MEGLNSWRDMDAGVVAAAGSLVACRWRFALLDGVLDPAGGRTSREKDFVFLNNGHVSLNCCAISL